jgi:dolichol-phosphate mannosyltransferase
MLVVMIPTYNERENIEILVNRIMHLKVGQIKIVIVDDSSPDGTGEIADEMASKNKNIVVIHRKERGRGSAGIRGFLECLKLKPDYIIEMDADFSHDPDMIPTLLENAKESDIVVGSRLVKKGRTVERNFLRNTITTVGSILTRLILGMNVKDIQSGYKCYKREVIESIDFSSFVSKGYSIGAETLYNAHKKGFAIKEIPIIFKNRERGKSKFNFNEMFMFFVNIIKIRLGL